MRPQAEGNSFFSENLRLSVPHVSRRRPAYDRYIARHLHPPIRETFHNYRRQAPCRRGNRLSESRDSERFGVFSDLAGVVR